MPTYLPATRYGGPIQSVHGLCRALVERGHEVDVFTTSIDGDSDSLVPHKKPVEIDGVQVTYHKGRFPRRLFASTGFAESLGKTISGVDVVHAHSMFLLPTLLACRESRKQGIPYLLAPRGMLSNRLIEDKNRFIKRAWISLFDRQNIEGATAIHVTSNLERTELLDFGMNLPPIELIPNGIDTEEIDQLIRTRKTKLDSPYALYLGRLSWKKGLEVLLKAWVQVKELELVIAGNDEENLGQRLKDLAASLGIDKRVYFPGFVAGADKWSLLRDARLFVLPSRSENFGIAVLEAMAAGCPVLVSPAVGLSDLIEKEKCGVVSDPTPAVISKKINGLIQDHPLLNEMGRNGARIAREKFSWSAIAKKTEAVYERILVGEALTATDVST